MNKQKVQDIINGLVLPSRLDRQYPASKRNLAKLEELGLIEFMPTCQHPSARGQIGQTDANIVIAEAEKAPGAVMNAYGEGEATGGSALWQALHEAEPETELATSNTRERTKQTGETKMSKSYDEIKGMIEVNGEVSYFPKGYMWITCRETDDSWIDTSYVVSATPVDTDDDIDAHDFVYGEDDDSGPSVVVWRVEDPHRVDWVKTREEAVEWMIEAASLYFDAEEA